MSETSAARRSSATRALTHCFSRVPTITLAIFPVSSVRARSGFFAHPPEMNSRQPPSKTTMARLQ